MLAALAYLENEDRLCRAANDNAAPSARAKLKFRLAAERRFDSQDQIPRYVYDASRKLVHVEDKNPKDGGAAERTDYLSVAGMDIARVITGQGIYYQHTDHLGSTVATTTSSGFLTAKERYTPFGETLDNPGLLSDQGGFTGHIKDSATGLNYMQARYYDPVIGRFLSVDPVGFLDNGNPGYFNRYAYTFNDPINNFDPDGMQVVTDEERLMVEEGNVDGFWQSRTERGDPIGSLGQEFGDNPDDQSVGTYLSSGGLESELGKQFVDESGGSVIPEQLDEAIKEGFDEARQNLARAHIEAVDNDKRGTENFLSAGQITDYHHDVFGSMGLPRNTFGGTMVTGTKLEGKISGALVWCKSCDKE